MDRNHLERLTLACSRWFSRRAVIGAIGPALLVTPALVDARKKRRRRKKKKKVNTGQPPPVLFNAFGCVNVQDFCENAGQCCSGICEGSKCQPHDASVCQAGQSDLFCTDGASEINCTGQGGAGGLCLTTTGNAGFCATDSQCVSCKKDADCQAASICGPGAACVVCPNCLDSGGTACVASGAAGCS